MNINMPNIQCRLNDLSDMNSSIITSFHTGKIGKQKIFKDLLPQESDIAEAMVYMSALGRHISRVLLQTVSDGKPNYYQKRICNNIFQTYERYASNALKLLYPNVPDIGQVWRERPWITEGITAFHASCDMAYLTIVKLSPYIYGKVGSIIQIILQPAWELMVELLVQLVPYSSLPQSTMELKTKEMPIEWLDRIECKLIRSPNKSLLPFQSGKVEARFKDYVLRVIPKRKSLRYCLNGDLFQIGNIGFIATRDISFEVSQGKEGLDYSCVF